MEWPRLLSCSPESKQWKIISLVANVNEITKLFKKKEKEERKPFLTSLTECHEGWEMLGKLNTNTLWDMYARDLI